MSNSKDRTHAGSPRRSRKPSGNIAKHHLALTGPKRARLTAVISQSVVSVEPLLPQGLKKYRHYCENHWRITDNTYSHRAAESESEFEAGTRYDHVDGPINVFNYLCQDEPELSAGVQYSSNISMPDCDDDSEHPGGRNGEETTSPVTSPRSLASHCFRPQTKQDQSIENQEIIAPSPRRSFDNRENRSEAIPRKFRCRSALELYLRHSIPHFRRTELLKQAYAKLNQYSKTIWHISHSLTAA